MNKFAGIVPFLRIALGFDMKAMHFYIAQTGLFLGQLVYAFRGSRKTIWHPWKTCPGMQGRSNKFPD